MVLWKKEKREVEESGNMNSLKSFCELIPYWMIENSSLYFFYCLFFVLNFDIQCTSVQVEDIFQFVMLIQNLLWFFGKILFTVYIVDGVVRNFLMEN